jgi:hypothetical protein
VTDFLHRYFTLVVENCKPPLKVDRPPPGALFG